MKAYIVKDRWDPLFATVVFAETAGKARAIARNTDACEDLDFIDISACRVPSLDLCYKGKEEMDWNDPEDRLNMVKLAGFECSREIGDPDCEPCPAKEWCGRYEYERENNDIY